MRLMMGLSTLIIAAVALLWLAMRPIDPPPRPSVVVTGGQPAPPAPAPTVAPPAPATPPAAPPAPVAEPDAPDAAPLPEKSPVHRLIAPRATPVPRPLSAIPTPNLVPPVPLEAPPSRVAVQNAVRSAKPLVGDCYAQALTRSPTLGGTLKVGFTVVADAEGIGRIRDAEIVGDGMQHPFLEMCVLEALGTAEYPAPEGVDGELKVTYPFVLQPGE